MVARWYFARKYVMVPTMRPFTSRLPCCGSVWEGGFGGAAEELAQALKGAGGDGADFGRACAKRRSASSPLAMTRRKRGTQ